MQVTKLLASVPLSEAPGTECAFDVSADGRYIFSGDMNCPFLVVMRELEMNDNNSSSSSSSSSSSNDDANNDNGEPQYKLRTVGTLTQMRDQIYAVAASRNGRWVASGCYGGNAARNLHISSPVLGRLIVELLGHNGSVTCAQFTHNDKLLLTGGGIGCERVLVWATPVYKQQEQGQDDTTGFYKLLELSFNNGVRSLRVVGNLLFVGKSDTTVKVFRLTEKQQEEDDVDSAAGLVAEEAQTLGAKGESWIKNIAACENFVMIPLDTTGRHGNFMRYVQVNSSSTDADDVRDAVGAARPIAAAESHAVNSDKTFFAQRVPGGVMLVVAALSRNMRKLECFLLRLDADGNLAAADNKFEHVGSLLLPFVMHDSVAARPVPFPVRGQNELAFVLLLDKCISVVRVDVERL